MKKEKRIIVRLLGEAKNLRKAREIGIAPKLTVIIQTSYGKEENTVMMHMSRVIAPLGDS